MMDPSFKPTFSPELLRRSFYVGPCILIRATSERRGDLNRVIDDLVDDRCDQVSGALLAAPPGSVAHVPFTLYSLSGDAPDLAPRPTPPLSPLPDAAQPHVSIVIATRDRIDLLRECIDSIDEQTRYPRDRLELVIVDNDSSTSDAKAYFAELLRRPHCKVVAGPGAFNFARLCNMGVRQSKGDIVILLNNDTTVIEPRWIERIVAHCLQPDVGAVGAKLLYPDGTIQHAGSNVGIGGLAAHRLVGKSPESVSETDMTREIAAVTGACLGIRREVFDQVGGLDETLRVAFNDVKLCLSCIEHGYRNIYISDPLLFHHESKSRGLNDTLRKLELQSREAIYARQQFKTLFQNDPYYSPNLSIETIDELAWPPRRAKPWRRQSAARPARIMMLSSTCAIGHGVALVVQLQAQRLAREGFEVIVAGPRGDREFEFEGCRRIYLANPMLAASVAWRENVDCIIAHTPPFFSVTRFLGPSPIVYFVDYGEPNPEFFPDRRERENIDWEKRFCAPLAKRILAISQAIEDQSFHKDVTVLRCANSHMASWSPQWSETRHATRARLGWQDKFVVLNVCRFGPGERAYKGIDKYIELKDELWFSHPDTREKVVFALAGKADAEDVAEMERYGLSVFPNVSDQLMIELYAASDLYMSFSKWEGYNLGIGQALAMGLPVIASDIDAHREFPITTTNNVRVANNALHKHFQAAARGETERCAVIFEWDEPIGRLVDMIRADLNEPPARDRYEPARARSTG